MMNDLKDLLNRAPFISYYEFMELAYHLTFEAESSFANINDVKQIENGISKIGIERIVNFDMDSPWDRFYAEKRIIADEVSTTIDFIAQIHTQIGFFSAKDNYNNWILENLKPLSSMNYFERIVSYMTGRNFSELLKIIIELVDFDNAYHQKINPAYKLRLIQAFSESDISRLILSSMNEGSGPVQIKDNIEFYKENLLNEIMHKSNVLIRLIYYSVNGDLLIYPMQYLYFQASQRNPKPSIALLHKFNKMCRESSFRKDKLSDGEINALMSE